MGQIADLDSGRQTHHRAPIGAYRLLRRLLVTFCAASIALSCSSNQPTPGQSNAASASESQPASGEPSVSESPAASPGFFTDPRAPHDLQPTLANASAASADIGWDGGTIEATAPDGSTYTLTIPPQSLPVETTITMTPLSALEGFGFAQAPGHLLGVEFEPDGLQLVVPATLVMTPTALPEGDIATGNYLEHGKDAALLLADTSPSAITFEITHFSGYWSIWPLEMEDWRVFELDRQEAIEQMINGWMAQAFEFRRAQQLRGIKTPPFDEDLRNLMKAFDFEELMLDGRLELAGNGCYEAQSAFIAFLAYDRQLQMMGIADDEALYAEFRRPIPPALFDLVWNLCVDEEYQRCAATGDWPHLAEFLLSQSRQRAIWEVPLSAEQIADAADRLRRCGHWRVKVRTTQDFLIPGGGGVSDGWSSEIDLRWKPEPAADLPFGLSNTTIAKGETMDLQVTKLDATLQGQHATLRNIQPSKPAQARITGLTFVHPWDGSEPVALRLKLELDPGWISYEALHKTGPYAGRYMPSEDFFGPGAQLLFGAYPPTIKDGWAFSRTGPYRAEFARPCPPGKLEGVTVQCEIEVIVEHTPD